MGVVPRDRVGGIAGRVGKVSGGTKENWDRGEGVEGVFGRGQDCVRENRVLET